MSFSEVVDEVQKLSVGEKHELLALLEKYLIDERRKEIYKHGEESRATVSERIGRFTSDVEELKRMMDEE